MEDNRRVAYHFCKSSIGANISGSEIGCVQIKDKVLEDAYQLGEPQPFCFEHKTSQQDPVHALKELSTSIKSAVYSSLRWNVKPITVGGDHSVVMGSIAAISDYCRAIGRPLYVLWFDAHADINTYEHSVTKNIHGMPLAMLTGIDTSGLILDTKSYLNIENLAYFGVRYLDNFEKEIIEKYNIPVLGNEADSFEFIQNKLKTIPKNSYIHVSFDADCLDPLDMPAVSTPEENGFLFEKIMPVLKYLFADKRVGSLDIVEYNPVQHLNQEQECLSKIMQIISLFKEWA